MAAENLSAWNADRVDERQVSSTRLVLFPER